MAFYDNPLFHLGAAVLGANRPGATAGQAIGQGLLGGMQSYQSQVRQAELIKREQALQQLREAQLAMATAKAKKEEKEAEELRAWMKDQGMDPRTPLDFAKMQYQSQLPQQPSKEWMTWQQYSQLPPQQQQQYLEWKRSPQWLSTGLGHQRAPMVGGPLQPMPAVVPPSQVPSPFIDPTTGQQVQLPPDALGPGETLSPQSQYVPATAGPQGSADFVPIMPKRAEMPGFKAAQTQAVEEAKIRAKRETETALDFPEAQAKVEYSIALLDDLLQDPGFSGAVGAKGLAYGFGLRDRPIAGTDEAGFESRLDQLKGQQFLEAFESLKGGGHITEIEGQKATQAAARMDTAQSEESFQKAAKEYRNILLLGLKRRAKKQGIKYDYKRPAINSGGGWSIERVD